MKGVTNYLKNVTRSVAYAAQDIAKEDMLPNTSEFADSNKAFIASTYATIRNPKMAVKRSITAIQSSKVYQAIDYGVKNTFEDLRTGNFYNKAREERDELRLSGLGGSDDWDDLSDFDIDKDWESHLGKDTSKEVSDGDLKIVDAIEGSNAAVASATVNAVLKASEMEIKNSRANVGMLYMQNEKLFGGLHSDLSILNSTMDVMNKVIAKSLPNMDKNMADFFTQEIKLSTERNAILKEMLEMQRNQYQSAADKEKEAAKKQKQKTTWGNINSSGLPEFDRYIEEVKKNISNEIGGLGLPAFSEDGNMLAAMFTSPLKGIVKTMVSGVIPATLKAASKELDSTVSGIFGQLIARLGNARRNDDGLFGLLGRIFGINTSVDRSINTNKFEKGPVPFDGITRKAIIDVIPSYLRRIEAHLTGSPEQTFDYSTGRWITMNSAKRKYDEIKKNAIKSGTADMREFTKDAFARVSSSDAYQAAKIERAKAQFWEFMYANNGVLNPKKSARANGIDAATYPDLADDNIFKALVKAYSESGYAQVHTKGGIVTRNKGISMQMNAARNVLEAKERESAQYRELEKSNAAIVQYMSAMGVDSHGKWKNDKFKAKHNMLIDTKDNLGNTIFDYLRNINRELTWFRQSGYEDLYTIILSMRGRRRKHGGNNPDATIHTSDSRSAAFGNINLQNANYASDLQRERDRETRRENEKVRKAMKAISDGKAADLASLEHGTEVAEYLLYLSQLMVDNNSQEFAEELRAYDTGAVAEFVESHIIHRNIKSTTEYRKAQQKDEQRQQARENQQNKEKTFLSGIFDRIQKAGSIAGAAAGAFSDVITEALYTADKAIYDMMFRAEVEDPENAGSKYNGFMDMMAHKVNDTFDKIAKGFKENFIKPFKQWLGIDDEWETRFKNQMSNIGHGLLNRFVGANRDVYGGMLNRARQATEGGVEGIRRRARTRNRNTAISEMDSVAHATSLYDHSFVQLMFSYGLNPADYEYFDDAKDALNHKIASYYRKNMGTGTEADADMARAVQYTAGRSAYSSYHGIANNNMTPEQFTQAVNRLRTTEGRNERLSALYGSNSDIVAQAEALGFTGTKDERVAMLNSMNNGQYKIDPAAVNRYDDVALAKRFLRAHGYMHAKGTMGNTFKGITALSQNEILINRHGMSKVNKTGVYNITDPTAIVSSQDAYALGYSKNRSTQRHDQDAEKIAIDNYKKGVPGHAEGTIKLTNANALLNPDAVMTEAKKYVPEAAAGGLVGGVLSMLLGIVGGPLIGGAVGAGASLITSSDYLKEKLFGKIVDGKRDGTGFINSTIVQTVQKYVPDAIKGGLAGVIPGLLTPLGPLGGMVVGAGISILKNNETFKEKYFGENGPLKITHKEKDILEKLVPGALKGAGVGAIATLFGGPFGLLGNAAIGAGLGLMASSDDFKDLLFGSKVDGVRSGGILGAVSDAFEPLKKAGKTLGEKLVDTLENNIIKPLSEFVTPFIHELPRIAGLLPRGLKRIAESKLGQTVGGAFGNTVGKAIGGVANIGSKFLGGAANIVTSPIKLLGLTGIGIRHGQINRHDADYMTAAERLDWNKKHGFKSSAYDNALAGIGTDNENALSIEDAKKIQELAYLRMDTESSLKRKSKASSREINSILSSFDMNGVKLTPKAREAVMKAVRSGKTDKIPEILSKYKMSDGNKMSSDMLDMLMNGEYGLSDKLKGYSNINARINTLTSTPKGEVATKTREIEELLASKGITGIDFNDKNSLLRLVKNIDTELTDREANGEDVNNDKMIKLPDITGRIEENTASIIELLQAQVRLTMAVANGGDVGEVKLASKQAADSIDKATEAIHNNLAQDKGTAASVINNITSNNEDLEKFDRSLTYSVGKGSGPIGAIMQISRTNTNRANFANAQKTLSTEEFNTTIKLAEGDVDLVSRVADVKSATDTVLTNEIIETIMNLSKTQFKHLMKCIKPNVFKRFLNGKALTKEDILFLLKVDESEFKNVIKDHVKRSKKTYADFKSLKDAFNSIVDTSVPQQHFLGTLLSGALGLAGSAIKGVGSLAVKGVKAVGSGIKNLVTGGVESVGGAAGRALNMGKNAVSGLARGFTGSTFDETDRAGDKKDIIQYGPDGDPIAVKKGSDGSIEPDTSDSKTKSIIDKITLREKLSQKANEAQTKIHGMLDRVFNPPEAKKKGFNWLTALLFGGALLGSGVLGKLWKGIITPLWENVISPWWNKEGGPKDKILGALTTVGGWVKDGLTSLWGWLTGEGGPWDKFKGWWGDTAWPWIKDTLVNAISGTLGNPEFWKSIVSLGKEIGLAVVDTVTGNKTNVGHKTTTSKKKMEESGDKNYYDITGGSMGYMTDRFGNRIYSDTIMNYVGQTVYNPEGSPGVVREDGTVQFADQSRAGSSFAKVAANAGIHAIAQGSTGIGMKAVKGADKAFTAIAKRSGFIGKSANAIEKTITFVPNQTAKIGDKIAVGVVKGTDAGKMAILRNIDNAGTTVANSIVSNATKNGAKEMTEKSLKAATKKTLGRSGQKAVLEAFKEGGEDAAKEAIERLAKEQVEAGAKKQLGKKGAIELTEYAAKKTGEKAAQEAVERVAKEGAEQAIKKGAQEAAEKKGIGKIVTTLVTKLDDLVARAFEDSRVIAKLKSVFQWLGETNFGKWIATLKSRLSTVFKKGATECAESSAKGAGAAAVKEAGAKLNVIVTIVMFIIDFLSGMDRAEAILGVSDTNIAEELFAGLMNAVCNLTIVLAIVPGVGWLCQQIMSFFEKDYEERVKAADKEYQEYIDSTGSTMTKEEYFESKYSYTGKMKTVVKDIYKESINTTEGYIENWVDGVNEIGRGIKKGANAIGTGVSNFANAGKEFKDTVMETAEDFIENWADGFNLIKNDALNNINEFGANWKDGIDILGKSFTNTKQSIGASITGLSTSISDKLGTLKDKLSEGATALSDKTSSLASKIASPFTNLGNKIEDSVNSFSKKLEGLGEKAKDAVDKGKDKVKKTAKKAKNAVGEFAENWKEGAEDIANYFGFGTEAPKPMSKYGTGLLSNIVSSLTSKLASKVSGSVTSGVKNKVSTTVTDIKRKFSASNLAKLSSVPMKLGKSAVDALGLGIKEISEYAKLRFNEMGIGGFFEDPASYIMALMSVSSGNAGHSVKGSTTTYINPANGTLLTGSSSSNKSTISKAVDWFKGFFGHGKYGTGYSKQIDPEIAGIRFNSSADSTYQTIGDSGCGPAAAVNAIEAYGRGNDVLSAANYAISHGYKETDGGTKPQFFTDYFRQHGYNSKYTSNKNSLADSIKAGVPTVLMGSDPNGVSDHTPYGRSPHYVTVTGMNNGYAVVQDPESMYDNQLYPMNELLSKSDFGVSAYGTGKNKYRAARVTYGEAVFDDTVPVYKYGNGKYGRGKKYVMFVGDSRTVGMQQTVDPYQTSKTDIWHAKSAAGFQWLVTSGVTDAINVASSNTYKGKLAIVCLMGVNGLDDANLSTYLNTHAKNWVDKDGNDLYFVSVNPVDEAKEAKNYYSTKNSSIEAFNSRMKKKLAKNIKYIDTYNAIKGNIGTTDGLHYTAETYKEIYKLIKNAISGSSKAASSGTTTSSGSASIGGTLVGILANSRIGQVLNSFLSIGGNNSSSSSESDSDSTSSSDASVVNGTDARSITWNYLAKQGFSKAAIAGTMGNMEGEVAKNYNKNIFPGDNYYVSNAEWEYGQYKSDDNVYDNGGGIIQWTPWKEKIGKYSKEKYGDIHAWTKSLPMQLEYLLSYIPSSIGTGSAYSLAGAGLTKNLVSNLDEFKKMTDVEKATRQWQAGVERPRNDVAHTDRRIGAAKWYYKNMENVKKKAAKSGSGKYGRGKYGLGSQYEKAVGKILADFSSKGYQSGLSKGQCTWYAEGRAYEKCGWDGVWHQPRGNGNQIYAFAKRDGYDTGLDPAPNSLVSMNSSSPYGHVMFVEDVDVPNKKIYYAEANSDGSGHAPDDGVIKVSSFDDWNKRSILGYVYAGEDKIGLNIDGSSSDSEEEQSGTTIGDFLSKVLSESRAGKALAKLTDMSTSTSKLFTLEGMQTSTKSSSSDSDGVDLDSVDSTSGTSSTTSSTGDKTTGTNNTDTTPIISKFDPYCVIPPRKTDLTGFGKKTRANSNAMDAYKRQKMALAENNRYKLHLNPDGTTTVRDRRTGKTLGKTAGYAAHGKGAGGSMPSRYGMAGPIDQTVINTIVTILMKIADNTDKLNLIVSILNEKLGMDITASDINKNTGTETLKSKLRNSLNSAMLSQGSDVANARDSINNASMNTIITAMNALASE